MERPTADHRFNQNHAINFLIPDPASPSVTTCWLAQISATYDVNARLAVPGIGLSLDDAVQVQYTSQLPPGKWLNIFSFTGLPVGDLMVLTPFQINIGDLWNGLAGALGTPGITLLNDTPGTALFPGAVHRHGLIPIAVYPNGVVTITAAEVLEPAPVWLLAVALPGLIDRKQST